MFIQAWDQSEVCTIAHMQHVMHGVLMSPVRLCSHAAFGGVGGSLQAARLLHHLKFAAACKQGDSTQQMLKELRVMGRAPVLVVSFFCFGICQAVAWCAGRGCEAESALQLLSICLMAKGFSSRVAVWQAGWLAILYWVLPGHQLTQELRLSYYVACRLLA